MKQMLTRYRDPEYTGANRCLPCTIGNLLISAVISAAVAAVSTIGGAIVFVGASAVIYFKGYLIPGTPTLTERYFPTWLLEIFGKGPTTAEGLATADEDDEAAVIGPHQSSDGSVDLEQFLIEYDLVEATSTGEDLQLTQAFNEEWQFEMDRVYDENLSAKQVAAAFHIDDISETTVIEQEGTYSLTTDGSSIGRWPSRAALVADVAAAHLLARRVDTWGEYSTQSRGVILNGLRVFLQRCPGSGGAVTLREETVESCCTSQQVIAATCEETGERILEQPL
ncbi:hypothetical protein ACFQL9_13460 [Halobaculum lipolyticum]|uniref:Uncharacterized protein n=1 Tax=Halobaculum lipolyticum TaxID=3032001 RepID=A0ABD5WBJ5_9EURY